MNAKIRTTTYRGHEIVLAEYQANGTDETMRFYTQTNDVEGVCQADTEEDGQLRTYQNPEKAIADAKETIEGTIDTAGPEEVTDAMTDVLSSATIRTRRNLLDAIRSFTGAVNDPAHVPSEATQAAAYRAILAATGFFAQNDSQWEATR